MTEPPQPASKHKTGGVSGLIRFWLVLTAIAPFVLIWVARRAHRRQTAGQARFAERLGRASLVRPAGRLVWIHAASVGEVTSVARLARRLIEAHKATILVTTTTATGAATVARLLPEALHQFVPVDTPKAVSRFIAHWQPDAALFVEGDLWPRMILSLDRRGCPMALVNARASRSRDRFPSVYSVLLAHMRLITVQDTALIAGLRGLGLDPDGLHAPGNLKADVAAPAVDDAARARIIRAAAGRGIWAAVSTHPGEEPLVVDAHARLSGKPLLLLVPRHPERGNDVADALSRRGLTVSRHSRGELPDAVTQVHLVDVMGETGTVYAAAGLAFVGGSLVPGPGGHTPYEPVALGCAVLSGPHVRNFAAAFQSLRAAGAACLVPDEAALAAKVAALIRDDAKRGDMQTAAARAYAAQGGATERTLDLLNPILSWRNQ